MSEAPFGRAARMTLAIGFALAVIIAWQIAIDTSPVPITGIPSPLAVIGSFGDLVRLPTFIGDLTWTFGVVMLSWLISLTLGTLIGGALGTVPWLERWSGSSFEALRSIPGIALLPATLLIFGFSINTELIVATFIGVWPMFVAAHSAARAVHPRLNEVSRMTHMTPLRRFTAIVLPSAAPTLLVGARLSLSLCLVGTIIAEMAGNPRGLGWSLVSAQQALRADLMFAIVVLIGILGIVLNAVLGRAATTVIPPLRAARLRGVI